MPEKLGLFLERIGEGAKISHYVDKDETVIGREGADVALSDKAVSRRHAAIFKQDGAFYIKDLRSSNGTFLNGNRVADRTRLLSGGRLRVGETIFTVIIKGDAARPTILQEDKADASTIRYVLNAQNRDFLSLPSASDDIKILKRAKDDLAALYRVGQSIATILDINELYSKLLEILMSELKGLDYVSLHILDDPGESLYCVASRHKDGRTDPKDYAFSRSIIECVLRERKAVVVNDAQNDSRFDSAKSVCMLNIHSAMCVPLQSRERIIGVIQADATMDAAFTKDDLTLLTAIGTQAGAAIENATLYGRLTSEKTALKEANEKLQLAQRSLVQSEKLVAVGQLSAGIVHDVKNPLVIISGHSQLLKELLLECPVKEVNGLNLIESVTEIEKGVTHCVEIITQLLQFARQTTPKIEPTDVNNLIKMTLKFVNYELCKRRVRVAVSYGENLPLVQMDANQIKQCLMNIIINAAQAMDEKKPTLTIRSYVTYMEDRTAVAISFEDNGHGMSEEVKGHLFEPFFTTKKADSGCGGAGLGLSTSYGIVRAHGGSIEVESVLGFGTTFTVKLPAIEKSRPVSLEETDSLLSDAKTVVIPLPDIQEARQRL